MTLQNSVNGLYATQKSSVIRVDGETADALQTLTSSSTIVVTPGIFRRTIFIRSESALLVSSSPTISVQDISDRQELTLCNTGFFTITLPLHAILSSTLLYRKNLTLLPGSSADLLYSFALGGWIACGYTGPEIGELREFANLQTPFGWARAEAQALSRTAHPALLSKLVKEVTVTTFSDSTTVLLASGTPTDFITDGVFMVAPGIPTSTIVTKVASTLTISNPATASATVIATFHAWGLGDGVTTFNLPNQPGRCIFTG
jgi:hypothetical protein